MVQFKKWSCVLKVGRYSNKRIALELVSTEDGSPVAKATVNIPEVKLKPYMTIIKDYSENEGMFLALKKAGVIRSKIGEVRSGFVVLPVVRLNMKILKQE
jgi:hypothetical protein